MLALHDTATGRARTRAKLFPPPSIPLPEVPFHSARWPPGPSRTRVPEPGLTPALLASRTADSCPLGAQSPICIYLHCSVLAIYHKVLVHLYILYGRVRGSVYIQYSNNSRSGGGLLPNATLRTLIKVERES